MLTKIGHELEMGRDFSFLFDDFFARKDRSQPEWNVQGDAAILRIEIPGVKPNDVDVSFLDNGLTIAYNLRSGRKTLTYDISNDYDISATSAKVELGILELRIPRVERKSTRITVEVK